MLPPFFATNFHFFENEDSIGSFMQNLPCLFSFNQNSGNLLFIELTLLVRLLS